MRRLVLGFAAGLVGLPAAAVAAEPGETVATPEGWYRVEPEGTPDVGQLSVIVVRPEPRLPPAERSAPAEPSPTPSVLPEAPPAPGRTTGPEEDPCRPQRARYAEILFRMAGIWDAPWALDLLEALGASPLVLTPWVQLNAFGLPAPILQPSLSPGVDPIRPLAWDADLRRAAKDLAACARARSGG